jgi:glycosyltransferase involved in cell wall biosynthesis
MKVCHITSVHKSHDVRIFEKECASLALAGMEVFFVVPNAVSEVKCGVQIIGVDIPISGRLKRMIKTTKMVVEKALSLQADVYHFHDPELLLFAKTLKRSGAAVIYDSHEDLPRQILDKAYIPKVFRSLLSWMIEAYENNIAKNILTCVIGATPYITKRFDEIGVKTININNYPRLESFVKPKEWTNKTGEICYVGGVFKTRGAVEMVTSLKNLNTKLNIAGNYSPVELRDELVSIEGWDKVKEHGFVDRNMINEILGYCNIGLVILHPTKSYIHSLPIKMFEYMAAGIPVIASNFELWKDIVGKHNCGICVDPLNVNEISKAVNYLLQNDELAKELGANGRKAVEKHYTWENEAEKLTAYYSSLS